MSAADEVMNNWQRLAVKLKNGMTDKAITDMMITTELYSTAYTPVATSNLINSQDHKLVKTVGGMEGEVGYYAEYAAYVHEAEGLLKGQQKKRYVSKDEGGANFGNYWDGANGPDSGEPKFLEKGRDEMIEFDSERILKEAYKI